jgi:hypothetical protein
VRGRKLRGYLASRGFDVTGVYNAPTAIKFAKENAVKKGVKRTFLVADVLGGLGDVKGTFDFACDWGAFIPQIPRNARSMWRIFAVFLTQKGSASRYSPKDELHALFEPLLTILELRIAEINSKGGSHLAYYCFIERKEAGARQDWAIASGQV